MATRIPSRGLPGLLLTLILLSISALAFHEMHLSIPASAVSGPIKAVTSTLSFPDRKIRLRETFTSISPIDQIFHALVAAFLPGVAGWDPSFRIQQIYFLFSFFPIIAFLSVEAGRVGASRLIRWTSLWALFYQTIGGAVCIPLYFLAYMYESRREGYWAPSARSLPTSYAKALLPALLIGYLLPTVLMYLPFEDPNLDIHQIFTALWQPSPALANVLLIGLEALYGGKSATSTKETSAASITHINRLYVLAFLVSAAAHIYAVCACLASNIPVYETLIRMPTHNHLSMTEGLRYIFQIDFILFFSACLIGAFVTLLDMKRMGKMEMGLGRVTMWMALGVILVGPGATAAACWWARDGILPGKGEEKEKI